MPIVVGALLAVASNALTTLGLLMQKQSAHLERNKPLAKRWRLWLGLGMNVGSELVLSSIALALTPLSIIGPLGGTCVLFSALFTHFGACGVASQKLRRGQWLATLLVCGGIVSITSSGTHSNLRLEVLYEASSKVPTVALLVTYVAVGAAVFIFHFGRHLSHTTKAIGALCFANVTMFLFKTVAVSVRHLVQRGEFESFGALIACALLLPVSALLQLYLLNMALLGDARFIMPLYMTMLMLGMLLFGYVLGEFVVQYPYRDAILLVGGVLGIGGGLLWLQADANETRESVVEDDLAA